VKEMAKTRGETHLELAKVVSQSAGLSERKSDGT
jgi:hypothetical protein